MATKDFVITIDMLITQLSFFKKRYGNLPLVYSMDDEGNAYNYVFYNATPVKYDESEKTTDYEPQTPNAICIN